MKGKFFLGITLSLVGLSLSVCGADLIVSVQIDGHSRLVISTGVAGGPAQVMWDHLSGSRPGTVGGNYPTDLNCYHWVPTWPDSVPNGSPGYSSTVAVPIEFATNGVSLTQNLARTPVRISQQPDATNAFTLVIDFNDSGPLGAAQYTITLHGVSFIQTSPGPLASPGSNPVLSAAGYGSGEFSFIVQGESKAGYVALGSGDLLNWTPFATNQAFTSTRLISFATSDNRTFARVQRMPLPVFAFAIAAQGLIDLRTNITSVDSFDSGDPAKSTNGRYDSIKAQSHGDIAAVDGFTNSGTLDIHGSVVTGSNGTVMIGGGGSVSGIITDDMNLCFPDAFCPFTSGGYVTYTTPPSSLSAGTYKISILSLSGAGVLTINGDVSIWAPKGLSMSGNGEIHIAPGGKLTIYTEGPSSIAGKGIVNAGDASRCAIYGLPSCTSISYSGYAAFTGVIYAPSANLSMNGSATSTYDFVGASVTKTVTMLGSFNIHFDEALQRIGPKR